MGLSLLLGWGLREGIGPAEGEPGLGIQAPPPLVVVVKRRCPTPSLCIDTDIGAKILGCAAREERGRGHGLVKEL